MKSLSRQSHPKGRAVSFSIHMHLFSAACVLDPPGAETGDMQEKIMRQSYSPEHPQAPTDKARAAVLLAWKETI
jgi:hypothetical protein